MMLKKYLHLAIFTLVIFVPALFQFGRENQILFFVGVMLTLAIIANRKSPVPTPSYLQIVLMLWLFWAAAETLFFSVTPYYSFLGLLPLLFGILMCGVAENVFHREKLQTIFAYLTLGGGGVIVFIGLYFLLLSENYGYLRIVSTFYHHNALAGFLMPQPFLILWLLFKAKTKGNALLFAYAVFIFMSFFLTFSRGGFISLGLGMTVFAAAIWKNATDLKGFAQKILAIILIAALGWGGSFVFLMAKEKQAAGENTAIADPWSGEREVKGETGFQSRLHYLNHALTLFKERPVTGFGIKSFGTEARRIQNDARFFSTDPHNTYARFFAELGFLGGLLFATAVGLTLVISLRRTFIPGAKVSDPILYSAFASAFLSMAMHIGGDTDFRFFAIILLFFCLAGLLNSQPGVQESMPKKTPINEAPTSRVGRYSVKENKLATGLNLGLVLVGVVALTAVITGGLLFEAGIRSLQTGDREGFLRKTNLANTFDPFNASHKFRKAKVLFENEGLSDEVRILLDETLWLNPKDRESWLLKGAYENLAGNQKKTEEALKTAINLAPYRDLAPVLRLADILLTQGRVEEAKKVAAEAILRFPDDAFASNFWVDPGKTMIKGDKTKLENLLKHL